LRALLQRVSRAGVTVDGKVVGAIDRGSRWLKAEQNPDGGYGPYLRLKDTSDVGLTAFVLYALARNPRHYKATDGPFISKAVDFVLERQQAIAERVLKEIEARLGFLVDVGLDYLTMQRSAASLSGGEAQRVKLSRELSRRSNGHTLYVLDEPSVGLHAADVHKLIDVLQRLVDQDNTVLIIEHHPDIIKVADWIIDLGPEGGEAGGYIMAEGTPEQIAQVEDSYTGHFLKEILQPDHA